MFNYNPNAGKLNQPMSLSMGGNQNALAAFGGGTSSAAKPPTTGMNPMAAMALMSMMGGSKNAPQTQTFGPEYNGGSSSPYQTQRDPKQIAYQQAIMKALMGGGM